MKTLAGALVIGLLVAATLSAASDSGDLIRPLVVVRTYDYFGVPAGDMAAARATASAILHAGGIETRWLDCWPIDRPPESTPVSCGEALGHNEFGLRILASPIPGGTFGQVSLGYSFIDVQAGTGLLSTVFPDQVASIAGGAGVDPCRLLGRAIAHEIGHLLLGSTRHSTHGLMRALWSRQELQREQVADWRFSDGEATQMRKGILTRSQQAANIVWTTFPPAEGPHR